MGEKARLRQVGGSREIARLAPAPRLHLGLALVGDVARRAAMAEKGPVLAVEGPAADPEMAVGAVAVHPGDRQVHERFVTVERGAQGLQDVPVDDLRLLGLEQPAADIG